MPRFIDITGNIYGNVTVLETNGKNSSGNMTWRCKCSCGKEFISTSYNLRKGKILSCEGCKKRINEVGNKYGLLTVNKLVGSNTEGRSIWECSCECGSTINVLGKLLRNGDVQSCGCTKSFGEKLISDFLKEHGFIFKKEYSFSDLRGEGNRVLRFDFAVFNSKQELDFLIECDGIQHTKASGGWNSEENFLLTKKRDALKNEYCIKNQIKLYRFEYTTLEELSINLLQWKNNRPTEEK